MEAGHGLPAVWLLGRRRRVPPGLTLSSNGHITGTPTQAGTYTFYIRQTDNCGIEGEGNAPFVIKIQGGAPPLVITSSTLGTGEADLSYR